MQRHSTSTVSKFRPPDNQVPLNPFYCSSGVIWLRDGNRSVAIFRYNNNNNQHTQPSFCVCLGIAALQSELRKSCIEMGECNKISLL